ncbi:YhcN/YlaJ family sporulation lipoprotein [Cytobacillus dafuensis]|uniref:YhcN/YlaJ family sporulation lipoprotein n=1 Tax=Cytobacillus dafuensis TaxID=1742359 RepID=A0A5B8Z4L3_CYTDA|nr:YhcN/YlaJ family sporulation lipoprotein [Cytobacillus dafuensis]QED47871.1 YhcN/YlaJ family sporulation lipoprotein [Cytobacillus dafuensis]
MKTKALLATALTTLMLSACGVNNNDNAKNNVNDTALNNRDVTNPTRVNNPLTNDDDYINNNGRTGNGLTPVGNNDGNQPSKMRVADRAVDKIVALPEVDRASVVVTDDNAYVAARLVDNNKGLSSDVERKIADQVKAADKSINDVYVSVNPDFYDRMTNYANDIRNGKPIEGLYDEFTNTVQRVFPTHYNK